MPLLDAAHAGRATRLTDFAVPLESADGKVEERVFDSEWSPVRDETGAVAGALQTLVEVTERRATQAALRDSEARHRLLIESWAQAVWETDADGVITADSPSWCAYTGQTLDEWLGYGLLDAIHPDDRGYAERQWRDAVAARASVDAEFRIRAEEGGWRWTSVRAAPVLDEAGRIEKWVGVNVDIDTRKRAEAAQRESEEKYRALFQSIDEGFCLFEYVEDPHPSSDYRFLEVNEAFEKQTGVTGVVGKLRSEVSPGAEDYWIETYAEVARTGVARRIENHHEETGRWYDVFISRVGGEGRRQICLVINDITARKRSEQAVRQSEERQAFLLKLSDETREQIDADAVAAATCRLLAERFDASRVQYLVVEGGPGEEVGDAIGEHVRRGRGLPRHFPFAAYGEGAVSVLRADQTLVIEDLETDPRIAPAERQTWRAVDVRASVCATLVKGGRITGTLAVQDDKPRKWTQQDIALVEEVAERTWASLERVRAEQALRQSEEKYRTLFETIDSGYALTDLVRDQDGQVIDLIGVEFNRNYTRRSGLPPFVGQRATDVITVDSEWLRQYEEVTRTGLPSRHENHIRDGDRWVSTHFSLVGKLGSDRVAVVFDDITERKRAEEALRESAERQAFLLKLSDALRAERDPVAVGQLAVDMVAEHMGVDRCYVAHAAPEGRGRVDPQFHAPELAPMPPEYEPNAEFPEAMRQLDSKPLIIRDLWNDPYLSEQDKRSISALGMESLLVGALRRGQQIIWGLAVAMTSPRAWTNADRMLVEEAAERIWAAIEQSYAEAALREGEEKYRTLFEEMDEGFALCELVRDDAGRAVDYRYIELNEAMIPHTGIDPEPLRGRLAREAFPDLDPWQLETYARVVDTRRSVVEEHHFEQVDRWLRVNAFPRGGDRFAVLYSDTTDRKRAEAELRESEERYRSLFEAMDEGFAICELVRDSNGRVVDYRYVEVNPAVVRHVGIPPEALQGRLASEVFGSFDPWLLATYARVVDEGRPIVTDHHFAHVDRWLHINVFPRGGDCIAAVYSDVSDRKRAEQTLRDSEHRQTFLLRFTDAIRSEANEQALTERAVEMLAEELAADRAYATRHYPAQDLTHVVHEVCGPHLAPLPATLRFSDFPEAGRQTFEKTLVYEDTTNDQSLTDTDKASLAAMGVGAFLSRPLRRDGSPVFALGVVSTLPRRWTSAEIVLIEEATERTWEAAERARAEAALRESEERYAGLFAASPAPILILRPDAPHFTIADVNDAYLAATMQTRENLIGRAMFDAFPDNPAAEGERNLRAALERALVSRRFELMDVQKYDVVRPDGTFEERWWKPANSPVVDVNGNVVAIIHHVADVTAEQRAAEALRANEERLRKVLNAETVGVVFFDFVGGIHGANDAFLSMIGYTREELEAGDVRYERLTPPEWRWRDEKTIAELKATGKAGPFEKEYTRKDGSRIWILCADKVLDERTAVEFIIDITERKRADAALQQSEERFRQFGEASQDILWMRDAETLQWQYLTPAFETIYGLSLAEAMEGDNYRSWLDLIVPEDRERADQSIARVRAGEHVTFEYRIRRPSDGAIRWLRNTDFPIRNAAGDVVQFGGTGHDFTAVRETERQLQTLMEGIPQLVWRSGDEGRWTWSSPQWQEFTGQSQDESHGLGWLDAVHADDREAAMRAWAAARSHGLIDVEYRVHRARDGAYLWHHTRAVPVRDEQGRIVEWLGTTTDVQQLKELQERQEVMVAELQHRTRNLIAVVRSIAQQTMAQTGPTEAFRDQLNHRLEALARVQGLLSRSDEEPITIEALIRMELDALGAKPEPGRIDVHGPAVRIRHSVVQTLALALHELATNARKYGALSSATGRLDVRWRTYSDAKSERLALEWAEVGGQAPKPECDARRGYGRELIEKALPYSLNAKTSFEHDAAGLRCTIDMPLKRTTSRRTGT